MAHQEQLSNGLNVVSFKQAAEDFGAVFVVPTPAVDSSGIAHLVEHLVFRTSDRYPARARGRVHGGNLWTSYR